MGTIASNLTKLKETKTAIREAIESKGVTVADTDTFASYADKISGITEDGEGITVKASSMSFKGCTYRDPTIVAKCIDTSAITSLKDCFNSSTMVKVDLSTWNTSKVTDMFYMFYGCSSLTSLDVSNWNTSSVTSMDYMFQGCNKLKSLNVSGWNTSKVTSFHRTFADMQACEEFIGLEDLDTSSMKNLLGALRGCKQIVSLDLTKWDVSKVYTIGGAWEGIFYGCNNLETVDVSTWNTASLGSLTYAFNSCPKLKSLDLSSWDLTNVTSDANAKNVFDGCSALTTLIGTHTIEEVEAGSVMCLKNLSVNFDLHQCTKLERASLLAVIKGLATITAAKTLTLGSTLLGKLTDEDKKIATDKGWTLA